MNILIRDAFEKVQRTLDEAAKPLDAADYRELLQELSGNVDGRIEGLDDDERNAD